MNSEIGECMIRSGFIAVSFTFLAFSCALIKCSKKSTRGLILCTTASKLRGGICKYLYTCAFSAFSALAPQRAGRQLWLRALPLIDFKGMQSMGCF